MLKAWSDAVRQCSAPHSQERMAAIDSLTELLQSSEWQLPTGLGSDVFNALRERLSDNDWCADAAATVIYTALLSLMHIVFDSWVPGRTVSQKTLLLIGDLVAEPNPEVDDLARKHVMQGLVAKVSHSRVVIRKAASQALVSYMQSTRDAEAVMLCLLRTGLESNEWRQRQATALFLSLPSTPLDGATALHRELVRAICSLFIDPMDQVAQSGRQALARVRHVLGESEFSSCIRSLAPSLRTAYEAPAEARVGAVSGSEDAGALEFGFINARLMSALREIGDWQVRAQAIAELQKLFASLPRDALSCIEPHLAAFTDLLATFLEDQNFKISLTSLQMLSDLLDRFAEQIRNGPDSERVFLAIVPRLMKKFEDNKIVIRQANFRLTKKLMAVVPPDRAVRSLLSYSEHTNSHIREQAISVLIQTLLVVPQQPLELYRAALSALSSPLGDIKPKVRQAALEAAAVIHDGAGASAFEALLPELHLGSEKENRIMERVRQGRAALPVLSADGLVEFTSQPGIGPNSSSAGSLARVSSAGRDRSSVSASANSSGAGACGISSVAGGTAPLTAESSSTSGGSSTSIADEAQPAVRTSTSGGAMTQNSDYSDLREFTAGGRKIATSKGRLPWETREGVSSRGKQRGVSRPLLAAAHEDEGASEHDVPPTSSSAREARLRAAMRIEVPGSDCACGSGPLSAPSHFHGCSSRSGTKAAIWSNGSDSHDGCSSVSSSERGSTIPSQSDFAREQKIQLWLPERSEAGGPPGICGPPSPSVHGRSALALDTDALRMGLDSKADSTVGPRDSLKLLKRRQFPHNMASDTTMGGHVVTPAAATAASAVPRAVSAASRAPQVRLPFEERQRSSSAPHKRLDGPTLPAPGERLEEGVRMIEDGHMKQLPASNGSCSSGSSRPPIGIAETGMKLGAASLCESGTMQGDEPNKPTVHMGAYPSRRPTGIHRAKCPAGGCSSLSSGPLVDAPGSMVSGRAHSVIRRSGELNLQLDGVAMSRSSNSTEDGTPRHSGASAVARGSAPASSDAPLVHELTPGGRATGMDGNAVKILQELRTEELKGLPALPPESTMQSLLEQLRSDDWGAHFDSINLLRRVVAWAEETESDGGLLSHLHSINLLLIQYADSLRSALAKNAVVCFRELFSYLGPKIEADLDLIVPVLIKKAGESNGFICEEANKALSTMVHSVSQTRAITALLGCLAHRNPAARGKAAAHLAKALELMGYGRLLQVQCHEHESRMLPEPPCTLHMCSTRMSCMVRCAPQSRELDRVLHVLPTMLGEGHPEPRNAAKHIIAGLTREARHSTTERERLEHLLRRNLGEPAYRKLRDSVDTMQHTDASTFLAGALKMNGGPSSRKMEGRRSAAVTIASSVASSADTSRRCSSVSNSSASAALDSGVCGVGVNSSSSNSAKADQSELDGVYKNLASADWSTRTQAVTSLAALVTGQGQELWVRDGGCLLTMIDHFIPRLTDSNSKVNVVALQALQQMVPSIRDGLTAGILAALIPALGTSLASSNQQVRSLTPKVIDTLLAELDHGLLVQPFASCVLYSPPKAKPLLIDKLRELSTSVYAAKPQLVIKHAVPTAFRLLEENRADLRTSTVQLLRMLHVLLGPSLFELAQKSPVAVQKRLEDIIQTL